MGQNEKKVQGADSDLVSMSTAKTSTNVSFSLEFLMQRFKSHRLLLTQTNWASTRKSNKTRNIFDHLNIWFSFILTQNKILRNTTKK